VKSVHVVVDAPVLDEDLCCERGFELLATWELVAQAAVERLDPGVLPRRSGADEDGVGALNLHQSTTTLAMNSGPWSKRTFLGAPRCKAKASKQRTTPPASMEHSTMARHSRLDSSITFRSFRILPSDVWSNSKSSAQMTFGGIGHISPTATPMSLRRRFLLRYGTRRPSSRHRR